jgi:hypothetical protein
VRAAGVWLVAAVVTATPTHEAATAIVTKRTNDGSRDVIMAERAFRGRAGVWFEERRGRHTSHKG